VAHGGLCVFACAFVSLYVFSRHVEVFVSFHLFLCVSLYLFSRHVEVFVLCLYVCFMCCSLIRIVLQRIARVSLSTHHVTHMDESCQTYQRFMSHYERVILNTWMSHVTHVNESGHTWSNHVSHV